MKTLLPFLIILLPFAAAAQQEAHLDSFDVRSYDLTIDLSDLQGQRISGATVVEFDPVMDGLQEITLDLYKLQVDSVVPAQSFTYSGNKLKINLDRTYAAADTSGSVTVYYSGNPEKDPSGWGGFYFSGTHSGYAWNLGVGFQVNPHPFGRAWFPCKDGFQDKAVYDFHITTDSSFKAYCNGTLQGVNTLPDGRKEWNWSFSSPISTYLASVAVAEYEEIGWIHPSERGPVDVTLVATEYDTANMRSSFRHLPQGLDIFEDRFGPQPYDRVGFVAVPFNGGAMEHATNIAYPRAAIDGSLRSETLWAHELSHHWFGDIVTCADATEMWLNEGFASYSENVFLEGMYGREAYRDAVRANHHQVLRYAHIVDEEPRPLIPIPHDYTYGMHVYNKGADVAHTLRTYLGDSLFFSGLESFILQNWQGLMTTQSLQQHLEQVSGRDLSTFFDPWVRTQGFPHFSVKSWEYLPTGASRIKVEVEQQLRFAPDFYEGVPLELVLVTSDQELLSVPFTASGALSDTTFITPDNLVDVWVNPHGLVADAVTHQYQTLTEEKTYSFADALMEVEVKQVQDSALLLVEHHWVPAPDFLNYNPGIRLHNYRYWSVGGVVPEQTVLEATIPYDGREAMGAYLDHTFIDGAEDSLVLMYREDPQSEWYEWADFEHQMGHPSDMRGSFVIKGLQTGQYALGTRDYSVGTGETPAPAEQGFRLFPNPADEELVLEAKDPKGIVSIIDSQGRTVWQQDWKAVPQLRIDTSGLASGSYVVRLKQKESVVQQKVVIQ